MKLFNKQRFTSMKTKQFQKYLVYALGEILLVVIGILIAVGINNFNQQKQIDSANENLKKQVIVQLKHDINAIEIFQKELDTLEHGYRKVLERSYDKSKIRSGSVVANLLLQVNTMTLDNRVVNLIDNANLNTSKNAQKLINLSSAYKLYHEDIEDIEDIILKAMDANLKAIEKTQDWYVEFITDFVCKNECIDFLLNNKDHKARMASLRFLYVNGYGHIVESLKDDLQKYLQDLE